LPRDAIAAAERYAYWENVLQRLIDKADLKSEMVTRNGISRFAGAATMKKTMEEEYPEVRAFLAELELAKK